MAWAYWGDDYTEAQCLAVVNDKSPTYNIGLIGAGSNWFEWDDLGLGTPAYGDGGCCYACELVGFPPTEYCGFNYEVITYSP